MSEIQIRPIQITDLRAFRALRLEALHNHPEAFGSDYGMHLAQPPEFWIQWLQQSLDNPEQMIFVAERPLEDAAELVGMLGIRKGESPKTQHNAAIWGVYIRPCARGQRLSLRLLEAARQWALANDVRIIKLGVIADNQAALRAYERSGYQHYGLEPKAIFYQGRDYNEHLMALELSQDITPGPEA